MRSVLLRIIKVLLLCICISSLYLFNLKLENLKQKVSWLQEYASNIDRDLKKSKEELSDYQKQVNQLQQEKREGNSPWQEMLEDLKKQIE